ncbi:MAG: bifunctional riboflavin kinase/FAD synthetase [Candidatus Gorgyraea atricola]|nr:bifunctional riboflavin kinase/FAD synthetase [Candidatus Gorgyraea atricola]
MKKTSNKKLRGAKRRANFVAAIGIFDGVHRGHQKILKKLTKEASRNNASSLLITFDPHPRNILKSKIPLLISLKHRLTLIKDFGVDSLRVIRFTGKLSRLSGEEFITKILMRRFKIDILVVGENFRFGYKGRGTAGLLKRYGFKVFEVKTLRSKGHSVSSTRIRQKIEKGDLRNASLMLGRPVTVLGTVVRGRRVGRRLGFPTANIDPHHEAIPPSGVYSVDAKISNRIYKGILNIGTRPTFGLPRTRAERLVRGSNIDPTIELHIFNFKKTIYGKDVEVIFKRKIRDERRFKSVEALRKQIQSDIILSKRA